MTKRVLFLVVLVALLLALPAAAETVSGLPLHVKCIAPGAIRLWVGDHVSSTAVCAVATEKGIVVIDTTNIPVLDKVFRKVIARELGRSDFRYLINTHGHADHVAGNGVYADCQIIAHEAVRGMMEEAYRDMPRRIEWNRESLQRQKAQLAEGKVKEEEKAAAKEQLIVTELTGEFLNSSPAPTFPTRTFTGKMTLDCGDTTLELFQAGGTHTPSDIFILVPQKGILFTGDMMADKWLTNTPGCLATFAIRTGTAADYPVLVKHWQELLGRQAEIRHYIPGHWNGELSQSGFKERFDYLVAMLGDVKALVKSGGDYGQFAAANTLKARFPALVNAPGLTEQGQQMSIAHLYTVFSGKISVSDRVQRMFNAGSFASEFAGLRDDILKSPEKYFYSERELTSLGYFLLNQMKEVDGAVRLFELSVKLFPGAWNAWDSLAEALYVKGEKEKALKLYRKSLELNPGNENGKKFVARIESELKG